MTVRLTARLLPAILVLFVPVRTTPAQTSLNETGSSVHNKAVAVRQLSEVQKQAIIGIQQESERKAAPAALRLAGIVRRIYENMLAEKPDEVLRTKLSAQMKEAVWSVLAIKGQSIRDIVHVLTPEQRQVIKSEMRKPGAPSDLAEVTARTFHLAEK